MNNQNKLNLKIYLEMHSRVLSTDNDKSIVNSKNKKYEKKSNINSVIKSNRLISNNFVSKRLLNNLNYKTNILEAFFFLLLNKYSLGLFKFVVV